MTIAAPSPMRAGLKGCCPRCGAGPLFAGFLTLKPRCDSCGLDFAFADSGDGPAFFVMSIVGIVVVALALWAEFTYQPPLWLQFATVFPALIAGCLATLQPMKAWLVAEQFLRWTRNGGLIRSESGGHGGRTDLEVGA